MTDLLINATYSAEDNKLRLYASERLERDLFLRIKDAGFKWAPKQELFVAPKWTPQREDICVELAGSIEAEQSTLVERAEIKAERLDALAQKREQQAGAFHQAAATISERFSRGQPILIGHHSERKARKDQDRMNNAMTKAVAASKAVHYWNYKAAGVEAHANYQNRNDVRARRIKTLLADLRDWQRDLNHASKCLEFWLSIKAQSKSENFQDKVNHFIGSHLKHGAMAPYYKDQHLSSYLTKGELSALEVVEICIRHHLYHSQSPYIYRWIQHILGRLHFERTELGKTSRYEDPLTPVIIQVFVREHGADSPKAKKSDIGFSLTSAAPLPCHIANSNEIDLSAEQWRDLMVTCGYEVPAPKAKKAPILNFKAFSIELNCWGNNRHFRQIEMTKAQYSALYTDYRGVKYSGCKQFRMKICKHPEQSGYQAEWCSVYLTDSKTHPAPESSAIAFEKPEEQ
ncbi:MAG: methyltransferase type 11 [SAR86 cluster bacterium]|uniref:Methyltransferase type 11 n=1 Tax=SAR86 cluster bacterium TaxID=2030880 RepID=A0A2A5AUW6_9GAMM|nr:MAG: methyltransferase type 11 [SAR86 cluster bacterium]